MKTQFDTQTKKTLFSASFLRMAFAFFAFIMVGATDGAVGVLLPGIQAYYHIDKAVVGLLFLASTAGYLLGSFNNGLLIERFGHGRFLILGVVVYLLGAGLVSLGPPFIVLLASFLILGLGVALVDPGLNSYVTSLPRSVSLLNYLHAFYGVGAWLGPLLAANILALGWGWNSVYLAWFIMSCIAVPGFWLLFRNERNEALPLPDTSATKGNIVFRALRLRVVWVAALFLLFYVGAEVSLGNWGYSFLTEERGNPALLSGWIVSGYWFSLTIGRLALARVAERVGNRRLIQGCLVGVVTGLTIAWFVPLQVVTASGLWLTGFSLGPIFPTMIALMPRLVAARFVPSAIGFLASLSAVGGSLCPWIAGNLAQYVGLWTLLPFVILLTGGMLILWLSLMRWPQNEVSQGEVTIPTTVP
jgi:fucose permease